MKHIIIASLCVLTMISSVNSIAATKKVIAKTTKRARSGYSTPSYSSSYGGTWASSHSPWDFSVLLGLYSPGFGIEALGAYRLLDRVVESDIDNSLSVESGLGYVNVNDTLGGAGVSYSIVEIPIMARWDFHFMDNRLICGPRAGFNFLAGGGSVSYAGTNYSVRGNALYFQVGGTGMYMFNQNWAGRVQLMFINYTAFTFGVTYFL